MTAKNSKPPKAVRHLADLTPDAKNARRHSPRNVGLIETALGEVGAARSIVIDEQGVILAGNATVEAAARAGIERVKVVEADGNEIVAVRRTGLTKRQKTRLALLDNAPNAPEANEVYWEAEVIAQLAEQERALLDGILRDEELAALGAATADDPPEDPGAQIDRAAELNRKWKVKTGDLWQIGAHKLLCGDCTDRAVVERVMGGEKANLVFTDPPYGVNFEGGGGNSIAGDTTYALIPIFFADLPAVLEKLAWVYVCGGSSNMGLYAKLFDRYFHTFPRVVVWDKCGTVMRHNSYHSAYEFIYFGYTKGAGALWFGRRDGEQSQDIWRVPKPASDERDHLTEKPPELARRAILNSCPPDGVVYEPFAGSGSTLVACEQTHRKGRAIEIEPKYCAVALQRLADMGLTPELVDDNGKTRRKVL